MWREVVGAGTPVYDVAGKKIGTVVASRPDAQCLEVRRGILWRTTLYVPLQAIEQVGPHGVYLRLSKREARRQPWERPPFGPTIIDDG